MRARGRSGRAARDPARAGPGTVAEAGVAARVGGGAGMVGFFLRADTAVIREAKARGLVCVPGGATPTEASAALAAGADGLKMFPAEGLPPGALKAWRAVLPRDALVFAVGGIRPDNIGTYLSAGASGLGPVSNLYPPVAHTEDVRRA